MKINKQVGEKKIVVNFVDAEFKYLLIPSLRNSLCLNALE